MKYQSTINLAAPLESGTIVAAVLIVGAFVAGRRSVKTPAPAREYLRESDRDAVETDRV